MIILLTTCRDEISAAIIEGILNDNGINCFITNDNFSSLAPGYAGIMNSGIQIMIDENDFEEAVKIIQETDNNKIKQCPICESTNISYGLGRRKNKKLFLALISAIGSVPMGNIRNVYICGDCGAEFND